MKIIGSNFQNFVIPEIEVIVEKPPRNSAGFCGEGQGLSWAVEPRRERDGSPLHCDVEKRAST
jgi:hypothetical protein